MKPGFHLFFLFPPTKSVFHKPLDCRFSFFTHSFIHLNSFSIILPQTDFDAESFHLHFENTVMNVLQNFSNIPHLIKIGIVGLESWLVNSSRTVSLLT